MEHAKLVFALTTLLTLYSSSISAAAVSIALDVLEFVAENQTSVATSFAVAHTVAGTGEPGSGVCGPRVSVTGGLGLVVSRAILSFTLHRQK
jgi:hypothetical protein